MTVPVRGVPRWAPTWKWWSATVVGAGGIATAAAQAGHWSQTLTVTAIGLAVQRLVAWITPNTTGGTA